MEHHSRSVIVRLGAAALCLALKTCLLIPGEAAVRVTVISLGILFYIPSNIARRNQ